MNTKEKVTLRQVPQGVIATVDERPKIGQKYYDVKNKTILTFVTSDLDNYLIDQDCHTIIASSFGAGKELVIEVDTNIGYETITIDDLVISIIDFNQPYEYIETETNVIINL